MPRKDKEDRNAYQRQWYAANRQVYIEKNRRLRNRKRQYLRDVKSAPCMDCKISYPYFVMDFDHREGDDKLGELGRSVHIWSWMKLKEEIAKCDVVCSNCHRTRTAKRGGWDNSGWDVGVPSETLTLAPVGSSPTPEAMRKLRALQGP